ncbi:uncharacterized protein LOC117589552 [Drosophila guanche]|uniref:Blast:Nucleolar pre-ribosomal-associated protein 1 n=1 Tax=Drosophila guanche TaxID=7266 RepID=A0A3B0K1G4_DROGU|nr:uncharacterized protein LOC117589552 [Drosophila guanche]SPP88135.1 blast:Nucleolar pre-ribosomal-associated protein 1 [Drosophila guanche]
MAIQPNQRKRKHVATNEEQQLDDSEVVVPKKISKKSDSPKKKKDKANKLNDTAEESTKEEVNEVETSDDVAAAEEGQQVEISVGPSSPEKKKRKERHPKKVVPEGGGDNHALDEAEISPDSGFEPEENTPHFPNDFKMMNFRTKLRSNSFITELRHFLFMCHTRPRIVAKYIEKRGKPLELAEAFDRIDKSNILHVDYLTEALHRIVMEILSNQKGHIESAAHGCRYFLKAHGGVLENLLQSSRPSHRRNALKLLTAIVCVEPQLGRQVLNSYDILSNVSVMHQMLSHAKNDYQNEETVRKAYIHFILAFLVEGNTLLIRNILDRGQLIGVLAKGLVYDDHVTVCVVLNALRQYVLENPDIQKTKKVLVFDLECCKSLRRLYDWEGPNGLPALFGKKQSKRTPNEQEAESVSAAVHELLLLLLTSRKHGICFDAMTHYRQKQNKLQGKVLGSLYRPYSNPRKTELVIKTLTACPDLGRNTVRNFSCLMSPARVSMNDVPQVALFLAQIIDAVPPSSLSTAFNKMTLTDLGFWIKELCLPIEGLLHITGKNMLNNQDFKLRLAVLRLLLAMMKQYSNYVGAIAIREQSKKAGNSMRKFKFDLLNHLMVHFPTIESILYSLYLAIKQQNQPEVNVLECLSITLDLVLLMCKENRAFVNKTSKILDYLEVLRPLYETDFDAVDQPQELVKVQLELKSIKTILLLFPMSLNPQEKLFGKVFRSFIKAYMLEDVAIKAEAGNILTRLFLNTGLFDSCSNEINIWLESLIGFDAETVENVVSILLTILCLDWRKIKLPELDAAATEAISSENIRKLFAQIKAGQTVQSYVEVLMLSKMMPLLLQGVDIEAPYDAYVEQVFIMLFHYHSQPEQVLQLYDGHLEKYHDYMKSWLPGSGSDSEEEKPKKLPAAIAQKWPLLKELRKVLTAEEPQGFQLTFKPEDEKNFELKLEEGQTMPLHFSLSNPRRNMIYVQDLLFVLIQSMSRQRLTKSQAEQTADYLIKFVQIASQVDAGTEEIQQEDDQQKPETHTHHLLHYIYNSRLGPLHPTQILSETSENRLNYVIFLRRLTEHCRSLPRFDSFTAKYRLQLVKALEIALDSAVEQPEEHQQLSECVALVDTFEVNASGCSQMLDLLTSKLQAKDYIANSKPNHYYELLLLLLNRLCQLKEPIDCRESLRRLLGYYGDFCELSEQQLEPLEAAILQFLISFHHHLVECDSSFFACFFTSTRKISKSAIRLASLLLERQPRLSATFVELLPENLEQKELVYPLLDIALSNNYQLPQALLQRCYQTYKNGFMKSIEKPQKAALIYREHAEASAQLIALCMPKSECLDYCQKQLKLDSVELFQIRVLREIYWQAFAAAKDGKQKGSVFVNYVNLNVQMLALDLKKQALEMSKLEQITWNCYDWWQNSEKSEDLQLDWSRLVNAPQWLNFCKSCLKLALHLGVDQQPQQDQTNALILKLLAFLCDRLYGDYSPETAEGEDPTPALLYDMICTYSCCFDHLLGAASDTKTHLLQLMETLARKGPTALQASHVPVILGAYHAKLSAADRYALALLEHYERHDVGLEKFRPFIWGESAVAHYALRAADEDERAKLQQQETNVAQVLALIVRETSVYTIENFPIWRSLHACQQLPDVEFLNPSKKSQRFGDNPLEKMVEQGCHDFPQEVRRLCPKREEIYESCYDPAFLLPLMMHCFAPGSVVWARWPVQNGLLAVSFCALSSLDKDIRLAAASCQQRYRTHFELSKFYERPLWSQAYDNIQAGLNELRTSWLAQRGTHGGTPRVPLIPALFIAHSFNLSTEPTHLLYKRLMLYLRLKQSFNFQTIPDFNVFFYSHEPEHHQYRNFMVELLRCGIKSSADLFQLVSTNTFKVLLTFYTCELGTLETRLLLLSVLSTCAKIPGAVKIMLEHVGIYSWLVGVICHTEFHQFDVIEGIISILNNLWYAAAASRSELPNYDIIQSRVHSLILQLLPRLSPRISVPSLARLLNVLWKTASVDGNHCLMSADELDVLLECVARHWPEQLPGIRYVKNFGGSAACPRSEYCDWLAKEQQLDVHAVLALSSLREYVSDWWQSHQPTEKPL